MRNLKKTLSRLLIVFFLGTTSVDCFSGIPVIDGANVFQNTASAFQNLAQVNKQIEEYNLQIKQFRDQFQNSIRPATEIWGAVNTTINDLMATVDTINYYKGLIGNIDAYLAKYKDLDYYRTSPCFTTGNCTLAEFDLLREAQILGSQAQNKAYDAVLKGIDKQQQKIKNDALELKSLQAAASTAKGRLEALGYANQLASQQGRQILQIRTVLAAQHAAWSTRQQVIADREARWQAAQELMTKRLSPDTLPSGGNRLFTEGL